ncbi:ubiquitin domain-containing protein DSK2b-like [Rutidosis leptorrhynchoides]|uniref:ubiquitin domain-containing protein DSK2b-like n=1 Tax=Rutidosis leptorrhynchoides TaxID=125765 RepID=UPI003A99C5E2
MAGDNVVTGANTTPLAAAEVSSVEPGGTALDGSPFPELELMQQELTDPDMLRGVMYLLNNPDILREVVMSSPPLREIVDRNPEIARRLNDPAIDRLTMAIVRNPERLREMIRNADPTTYKNIQEPLLKATRMGGGSNAGNDSNLTPSAAVLGGGDLGGAAQNLAANPETTGGALEGAETTTGSPAPRTDPLPKPWAAGAGKAVPLSRTVTLNIRLLNGKTFAVQASLKAKVDLFKFVIEKNSNVPAAEQRLVFKGQEWFELWETLFSELTKGPVPPEEKYATQLRQLEEMGFTDARENLQALTAHAGDVYATVELLRVLSAFH